jgi:lantibiotic modifying enzyme
MKGAAATYLEVAGDIATYITQTAIWHEDRCTWIGAMPEEGPRGAPVLTYRSFGGDLYGGTAGVGLFLAEVASVSPERIVRDTAMGALRHAAGRAHRGGATLGHGLYSGTLGVAYSLARSGQILQEPEFIGAAAEMVRAVESATPQEGPIECDMISGLAGQTIGFLVLARMLGDSSIVDRGIECARRILTHALTQGDGLCWPSATMAHAPALLGFSHGASGIAIALLEAARASGKAEFREAAHRAFAYERSLYDAEARNWPDLRNTAGGKVRERSFATFWCHGAPGVALARIRAMELGGGDFIDLEAKTALDTTRSSVREGLESGQANFSLCHGVCGNAEVLLEGPRALSTEAIAVAEEVAELGSRMYASNPMAWPCGTHGGSTPGLLLGLAGIGHFFLRLARPDVPSVLLFRP